MRRPTLAQTGAGMVATVAGYASFRHIVHVAQRAGEVDSVAVALPFAVDGLILAATAAMADDKRDGRYPRWAARVALVAGIGATLAANIASAQPGFVSRAVAAWPALAFLLAVEVLIHPGKKKPTGEELPAEELPAEELPAEELPADDLDAELVELLATMPPAAGRGSVKARVQHLVTARPALADEPARVHSLVGGSPRQVRRVLSTLTAGGAPA